MQLSAFQTYVGQYFNRTDKDDVIIQAYNDSIKYISIWMPHEGYKYQSWLPTVIGQPDYPLPTTMLHLMHPIKLLDGFASTDNGKQMRLLNKEEYDRQEPNPSRANPTKHRPHSYNVYSQSIWLSPIPDKIYLLEIDQAKRPVAQALSADVPLLGSEYEEVLLWLTLERVYSSLGQYDESVLWGIKAHDNTGIPTGVLKRLLTMEKDREGIEIDHVHFNRI